MTGKKEVTAVWDVVVVMEDHWTGSVWADQRLLYVGAVIFASSL